MLQLNSECKKRIVLAIRKHGIALNHYSTTFEIQKIKQNTFPGEILLCTFVLIFYTYKWNLSLNYRSPFTKEAQIILFYYSKVALKNHLKYNIISVPNLRVPHPEDKLPQGWDLSRFFLWSHCFLINERFVDISLKHATLIIDMFSCQFLSSLLIPCNVHRFRIWDNMKNN